MKKRFNKIRASMEFDVTEGCSLCPLIDNPLCKSQRECFVPGFSSIPRDLRPNSCTLVRDDSWDYRQRLIVHGSSVLLVSGIGAQKAALLKKRWGIETLEEWINKREELKNLRSYRNSKLDILLNQYLKYEEEKKSFRLSKEWGYR